MGTSVESDGNPRGQYGRTGDTLESGRWFDDGLRKGMDDRNAGITNRIVNAKRGDVLCFRPGTLNMVCDTQRGLTWRKVMKMLLAAGAVSYDEAHEVFIKNAAEISIKDIVDEYVKAIEGAYAVRHITIENYLEVLECRFLAKVAEELGRNENVFRVIARNSKSLAMKLMSLGSSCLHVTPKGESTEDRMTDAILKWANEPGVEILRSFFPEDYCREVAKAVLTRPEKELESEGSRSADSAFA